MERDEDLTAPYAFQNKTWIAFEDKISVGIKVRMQIPRSLAVREKRLKSVMISVMISMLD